MRTEVEKVPRDPRQSCFAVNGSKRASTDCVDAAYRFLYDNLKGRLAQRLERSVYTRKVVRSNRTVPTIVLERL
jgi:hypothetical protein